MKLRYIFATLIAALTVFAGCEKEADNYLDEVRVSSSYLAFPAGGGAVDVTVTAIGDWTVKDLPDWISSSAMAGAAGESTVKFTATPATETREASFSIECAGKTQTMNAIQVTEKVEPKLTSMADVIAAGAGSFRIKGTVTKIANTSYGNWYLNDGTTDANQGLGIYVYGTLDKKGNTWSKDATKENLNCPGNPDAWELAVGDIITIDGPYTLYNGVTPEMVDVTVVSIERSLIGIDKVELLGVAEGEGISAFPLEGGSIKVTLKNKGEGFHVVIPDAAKAWLHIEDFGSDYVTLSADPNAGGDRKVSVSFTTTADGVAYSCEQEFTQKGAILEVPVKDFLAAEVGDTQYRLTGVIMEDYASDKDGQSFYIQDYSGKTLVYKLNDYKASGAKVGDIITVVGKRGAYKDSPQMVSGVYEKHFSVKKISIADFNNEPKVADKNNPDVFYMVTGTVKSLLNNKGEENDWGNLYITDGTNDLYLYGLYPGWGATGDARKGFVKSIGLKVGDTLTSIGYKDVYNDLIELCGGIYFSHEAGSGPGPEASITIDGNPAEWAAIQGAASDETPADAVLGGIKSAKVYYGDRLYILTEFSDDALAKGVTDGKLRYHVYFSGAEGLLAHHWADPNIEYMMEGKATSGGSYVNFSSPLYKNKGGEWSWDNSGVTLATECAGNGNFYEVAIDYSNYPGGFPEQIEIGIDCADGDYVALGYAPQKSRKFALKKGEVVVLPDLPSETPALFLNEFDTKEKKLEIYNSTDAEVDIAGWLLVKDDGKEDKDIFTIPASLDASKVPAKGYAVFTCKQSDAANGPLFGLSGTKGFKIELKKGDVVVDVADNLTSITQIPDGSSWGRETDGAANFVVFDTPTIGGPNGGATPPADEGQTVSDIIALDKGAEVASATSLVTAVTSRGFVATDGSKAVYVYTHGTDFNGIAKVGDNVKFSGSKTLFNNMHEVEKVSALEVVSSGNEVKYPAAKDVTAEAMTYTAPEAEYITFAGTLAVSGNFFNVNIDGADSATKQGSVVYPVDTDALKALDGKHLRFTGYFNGLSSKDKYLNIIATSIKEESEPGPASITLDGNMSDWDGIAAISNDGSVKEWKYASDAENIYFYYKIDSSDIKDKEGSYNWRRYMYVAFDTDNNAATGLVADMPGGLSMPGSEAIALVYPFRGTVPEGQTYPAGVEFVNGVDEQGFVKCPADGDETGKVSAFGYVDGDYGYLEIGISKAAIGSPAPGKYNVQHSFSWNLTEAAVITVQ